MSKQYSADELNNMRQQELVSIILSQQEQVQRLNDNLERLIEQIRIANSYRFGRKSENIDVIDGQLSFFDESEATADPGVPGPPVEEVVQSYKRKKQKASAMLILKVFPLSHFHTGFPKKSLIHTLEKGTDAG